MEDDILNQDTYDVPGGVYRMCQQFLFLDPNEGLMEGIRLRKL